MKDTAYLPQDAESNLETVLLRCSEESADCSVCHEVFYDKGNLYRGQSRTTILPYLPCLGEWNRIGWLSRLVHGTGVEVS